MAQTVENAAVNNTMIVANAFKEKACLPWFKGTKALAEGKGKAAFKKAAEKRLEAFEAFAGEGDPTAFAEKGPLCEITRSAWAIADAASKADPTGTTPMGALGVGLGISDPDSINLFKEALIQAVTWAARQLANEKAQAEAKAQTKRTAEAEIKEAFDSFFEEEGVEALDDPLASDEKILIAAKTLCSRIQKFLRQELAEIQKNGSGTVARAEAILERVRNFEQALRQGLSDKALNTVGTDGVKIWISNPPFPATTARTARRILESCQVKVSALQSRADRTLSRLRATKGVGSIKW